MPKNTKSLVALLLGLIIIAVAYFGTYTQFVNWGVAKDEHAISKEKNEKLVAAQTAANAFLAKYESNRSKIDVANKVLPLGDPDAGVLLANFEQIAKESGFASVRQIALLEDRVNSDTVLTANAIRSFDVNLVVSGSYEAFNNLLLRMQRNLRLVDLINISVNSTEEEGGTGGSTLEYTLTFRTYYQD